MAYVCPLCGGAMEEDEIFSDLLVLVDHIKREHTLEELVRVVGLNATVHEALTRIAYSAEWVERGRG